MADGWIKVHRQIQDTEDWLHESFTRGQAWIDMLLLANHKKGSIRVRGIVVDLDRGQLGWSEESLAKRWKWSRGKVRRFISEMESETVQRIVQQKNFVSSVITILNYDKYQSCDTADGTANGTANGQQTVQQTDTNKNGNKNKNEKKNTNTSVSVPETLALTCGFIEAWEDWKTHLSEKRKRPTPSALRLQLKKLESLKDPIGAIRHSISNNWQGIFEPFKAKQEKPDFLDEIKRVDALMRKKYGIEQREDPFGANQPMLCSAPYIPETGDNECGDSNDWD